MRIVTVAAEQSRAEQQQAAIQRASEATTRTTKSDPYQSSLSPFFNNTKQNKKTRLMKPCVFVRVCVCMSWWGPFFGGAKKHESAYVDTHTYKQKDQDATTNHPNCEEPAVIAKNTKKTKEIAQWSFCWGKGREKGTVGERPNFSPCNRQPRYDTVTKRRKNDKTTPTRRTSITTTTTTHSTFRLFSVVVFASFWG
jgi:hypothetical protein